jgi:putative nucleotidyltransferase with HDIG domain
MEKIGILLGKMKKLEKVLKLLRYRDPTICGHFFRVSEIAGAIAKELNITDPYQLEIIKHGTFSHDVGKTFVPDGILLKEDVLSKDEWEIMKKHLDFGIQLAEVFLDEPDFLKIVFQHHEAFDGSGYPTGLKGEEIYIGARICAVADSFDAMHNGRIYSPPKTLEETLAEIDRCSGSRYDPAVVSAIHACAEEIEKNLYSERGAL